MIIPLRLDIKDFFGIKDLSLDLPTETSVFHLMGTHGSGKSSILDAIPFALWGKVVKRDTTKQSIIREGAKDCLVCFSFRIEDVIYRIERTAKKSSIKLFQNENPLAYTGTQREIDKLIGIDFDFFQKVCYYGQETTPFRLLKNKEQEEFMSVLFQDRELDVLEDKVSEGLVNLESQKTAKTTLLDYLKLESKRHLKNTIEIEFVVKQLEKKFLYLSNSFDFQRFEFLKRSNANASKVYEEILILEKQKDVAQRLIQDIENEISELQTKQTEWIDLPYQNKSSLQNAIDTVNESIKQLEEIKNGFYCNRCDTLFGATRQFTKEDQTELEKLSDRLKELGKAEKFLNRYGKLEEISKKLSILENNLKLRQSQYKDTSNSINQFRKSLLSIEEKQELEGFVAQEKEIDNLESNSQNQKHLLVSVKGLYKQSLEKRLSIKKDLQAIQKNIELTKIWKKGFSDKGLKRIKIDSICKVINERIKELCSIIKLGIDIELRVNTNKTYKAFSILHNGRECSSSSGAEKDVIDLILFLVFNSITKHGFSFIVLDEVFKNCNQKYTKRLFDIISRIDYLTTIVVSHRDLDAQNVLKIENEKITLL